MEIVESETAVIARVRDTGRGFSEEEATRAGEPFAAFERTGSTTGLGLGLAIATALAERMGGEMMLVRNQAAGTTAELRLQESLEIPVVFGGADDLAEAARLRCAWSRDKARSFRRPYKRPAPCAWNRRFSASSSVMAIAGSGSRETLPCAGAPGSSFDTRP